MRAVLSRHRLSHSNQGRSGPVESDRWLAVTGDVQPGRDFGLVSASPRAVLLDRRESTPVIVGSIYGVTADNSVQAEDVALTSPA